MAEKITLSKKDRWTYAGVILSFRVLGTMNVCRMVVGVIAMIPAIKKLYKTKEDRSRSIKASSRILQYTSICSISSYGCYTST